jgi:predicted nucleic acid-binding protein
LRGPRLLGLLPSAWVIARRFDRTINDALYVALAEALGCRLVTADRRFYNALSGSPLGNRLVWVEDAA